MMMLRRSFATQASSHGPTVLSLLTYFRLPEQGMREYDILSRSSATLIELKTTNGNKFGFLGPAHVTQPWEYRHYYNLDWLSFVNSSAVKAYVGKLCIFVFCVC